MDFRILETTRDLNDEDPCILEGAPQGMEKQAYKFAIGGVLFPIP